MPPPPRKRQRKHLDARSSLAAVRAALQSGDLLTGVPALDEYRRVYPALQPWSSALLDTLPIMHKFNTAATFGSTRASPVLSLEWSPVRQRLLVGTQTGEIHSVRAHDAGTERHVRGAFASGVRAMRMTPGKAVLITGDSNGNLEYWDPVFYPLVQLKGVFEKHVRAIACSPTGAKFVVCGEAQDAKIYDTRRGELESLLVGHGWDVRYCDWHPRQSLVATCAKDGQIKLWDARAREAVQTLFYHKVQLNCCAFSPCGTLLASGARDGQLAMLDLTKMQVRYQLRATEGEKLEVSSMAWRPDALAEPVLATGDQAGVIRYFHTHAPVLESDSMAHSRERDHRRRAVILGEVPKAHVRGGVGCMLWHPLGHMLVTGGADNAARFWARKSYAASADLGAEDVYGKTLDAETRQLLSELNSEKPAEAAAPVKQETAPLRGALTV